MSKEIKVVELFAGVGGFRLGLDGYSNPKYPDFDMEPAGNFHTIWANNWEPDGRPTKQFAWRCYEKRFGEGSCVNEDIAIVVEQIKSGERELPEFDMLVGGSLAKLFGCEASKPGIRYRRKKRRTLVEYQRHSRNASPEVRAS